MLYILDGNKDRPVKSGMMEFIKYFAKTVNFRTHKYSKMNSNIANKTYASNVENGNCGGFIWISTTTSGFVIKRYKRRLGGKKSATRLVVLRSRRFCEDRKANLPLNHRSK